MRLAHLLVLFILLTSLIRAEPLFRRQDIFTSGVDGVNIYRIPALIVSPKGTLLAFCEAREGRRWRSHGSGVEAKPVRWPPPQSQKTQRL